MSSTTFVVPLRLELIPSQLLRYYLILLHATVLLASMLPSRLPWMINALWMAGVIISAYCSYRTLQQQQLTRRGMRWVWQDTDRWYDIVTASEWRMRPDYFLTPWLIVLSLRNDVKQRRTLLVWQDQLSAECYRALYRQLKFWRAPDDQPVIGE